MKIETILEVATDNHSSSV